MAKSIFRIGDYTVVIPHVQNLYAPEETAAGWQYGLKYQSGVFEYFPCKTEEEANHGFLQLEISVEEYYTMRAGVV